MSTVRKLVAWVRLNKPAVLRFVYFAGCRMEEARAMRWADVALDKPVITLKTASPA